jgi:FkbM family methyltransferase
MIAHQLRNALRTLFPKVMHARAISHSRWIEEEEDILYLIVDPSRECIDVGANIGRYAIALSQMSRHVYAFEPDAELAAFLKRAAPANLTVLNQLISDHHGILEFYFPSSIDGSALGTVEPAVAAQFFTSAFDTRTVQSATLDDFADKDIGFVKIDIEGHEYAALLGAKKLLQTQKPTFLVETEDRHNAGNLQKITALFAESDYEGLFIYKRRVWSIDEFTPAMQDPCELNWSIPRRQWAYVNNFVFTPHHDLKSKIERHYSVLAGC